MIKTETINHLMGLLMQAKPYGGYLDKIFLKLNQELEIRNYNYKGKSDRANMFSVLVESNEGDVYELHFYFDDARTQFTSFDIVNTSDVVDLRKINLTSLEK